MALTRDQRQPLPGACASGLAADVQYARNHMAAMVAHLAVLHVQLADRAQASWREALHEHNRDAWRDAQHLLIRMEAAARQLEDALKTADRLCGRVGNRMPPFDIEEAVPRRPARPAASTADRHHA